MTDENIELVEGEYGQCVEERPARQIRTRLLSFQNIRDKYNSFRIGRLQKKLDNKITKALTQDYTEDNFEEKIDKSAKAIAKLEEKIKILSKESVPTNYVARRAIKLRRNMMEHLVYHTSTKYDALYRIGIENRDAIMNTGKVRDESEVIAQRPPMEDIYSDGRDSVADNHVEPIAAAAIPNSNDNIDVDSDDLDRKSIMDVINESFNNAQDQTTDATTPFIVPPESYSGSENTTDGVATGDEASPDAVDKDTIRKAVEEAFQKLQTDSNEVEKGEPETTFDTSDPIRVSRNNTTSVRPDQFDGEGHRIPRPKKYNYTPMTDEEIRESQIKLGFDEHGNVVAPIEFNTPVDNTSDPQVPLQDVAVPVTESDNSAVVRETPIVTPERTVTDASLDLGDEKNMFDIIPQEAETPVEVADTNAHHASTMTVGDYETLREKIMELRKRKDESAQHKIAAEQHAQETATAIAETQAQFEASQESYRERMEKLRAYAASLEAACDENQRGIEAAEKESKEREDQLEAQRRQIDTTNQIVSEIDRMMSDYPTDDEQPTIKRV